MSNLEDEVKELVCDNFVDGGVNALNNEEFLSYISEALDRVLADRLEELRNGLSIQIEILEERVKENETD